MTQPPPPILLVEDDLSLRDSLCQFLRDQGYSTLTAATAAQGWELARSRRPRLCLLDLNLPDGSGLDLLRKIVQAGIDTRVVVMTAFDLKHLRPADAAGVLVGWLAKPVHPVELLVLVEKVLEADAPPSVVPDVPQGFPHDFHGDLPRDLPRDLHGDLHGDLPRAATDGEP